MSALGEPGRRHVPFRATALTRALRGALGGAVRTTLVACVWDSPAHSSETLATCRCARCSAPVSGALVRLRVRACNANSYELGFTGACCAFPAAPAGRRVDTGPAHRSQHCANLFPMP